MTSEKLKLLMGKTDCNNEHYFNSYAAGQLGEGLYLYLNCLPFECISMLPENSISKFAKDFGYDKSLKEDLALSNIAAKIFYFNENKYINNSVEEFFNEYFSEELSFNGLQETIDNKKKLNALCDSFFRVLDLLAEYKDFILENIGSLKSELTLSRDEFKNLLVENITYKIQFLETLKEDILTKEELEMELYCENEDELGSCYDDELEDGDLFAELGLAKTSNLL